MGQNLPTILQIIPQLDAGGAELSAVEIADAVVRAGGRAIVLAEPGRLAADIAKVGGEVVPFPAASKNPVRMLANARAIARIVHSEHVDLVHARSRAPAWSAMWAARRTGVRFVTTYHGAYGEKNALKRLYNSVMARGDVVIANSRYTARLIAERYATPGARIEVIARGVDVHKFDPESIAQARVAALRDRWGVGPGEPVILLAARLTGWKGQTALIAATAKLQAMGRLGSAAVVLAGDAQGRTAYVRMLEDQIDRLGLKGRVRLVGHVEDVAAAFAAAHVTVVASTEPEAFGRTAIEAAAVGCPVIATDIGAPPETVLAEPAVAANAITGWLVPPGDADALAARLADALALAPAARRDLGQRARRHILGTYTVEAMQRRTLAVYDRLLGTALEHRFGERLAQRFPAAGPRQT
ncbi:MAG TPA: glycosyltransferase family 4 protein [Hyphomicrobiaceae bacterium]|nr:glycosyltransferase family 4 protein [Hyphomicrobiaceae bacterium]